MRNFILSLFVSVAVLASAAPVCAQTGFEDHNIALQTYMWNMVVYTKSEQIKLQTTSPALRPTPDDIKIYVTDLNDDGRPDFVATIDNFLYYQHKTYPLYIMIAGNYHSYSQLGAVQRISTFDIKALPESTNGFLNLSAGKKLLIFDGKNYIESK